jgi:hypothetical protein
LRSLAARNIQALRAEPVTYILRAKRTTETRVTAGYTRKGEIMKTKAILFVAAVVLVSMVLSASAISRAAAPDGWKVLIDRSKTCQISVPSDWKVDQFSPSSAGAPDNKSSMTMHASPNQTLAKAKGTFEMLYPPTKVIEDSAARAWIAYKADGVAVDSPEVNWYVAIPVKTSVCAVQIDFKNPSSEAMMKQLAESMSVVK